MSPSDSSLFEVAYCEGGEKATISVVCCLLLVGWLLGYWLLLKHKIVFQKTKKQMILIDCLSLVLGTLLLSEYYEIVKMRR